MKHRKLVLSISAVIALSLTLTSTTYAWFSRNNDAIIDNFDINIEDHDGLLVSVDGINYYNAIDNNNLYKAIAAKRFNKLVSDVDDSDITKVKQTILSPVSTYDLNTFTTISNNSKVENGYYLNDIADVSSYISFDLYFKVDNSKSDNLNNYYLSFLDQKTIDENNINKNNGYDDVIASTSTSYLKSNVDNSGNTTPSVVSLLNSLYTNEEVSDGEYKENSVDSKKYKKYSSGDAINVTSSNALRIGIKTSDDKVAIYEPSVNMGYGSYALNSDEYIKYAGNNYNINYDSSYNAMFTYFNNRHVDKLKALENVDTAASYLSGNYTKTYDVYTNTEKDFESKLNFGEFNTNNLVKITVYIYLEGYDADFIDDVSGNVVCYLNFQKVEVSE